MKRTMNSLNGTIKSLRRGLGIGAMALSTIFALPAAGRCAGQVVKPSVAVLHIPMSQAARRSSSTDQISGAFTRGLETGLVGTNRWRVVERQLLEQLSSEIRFDQTGMVSPASAKKVGQVTGAAYLLCGQIERVSVSGGESGSRSRKSGSSLFDLPEASVEATVKLVNIEDTTIVAQVRKRKEVSKIALGGDADLGQLLLDVVVGLANDIAKELRPPVPQVQGKVLKVDAAKGVLYIEAGSDNGVVDGMIFLVYTAGEEIRNDKGEVVFCEKTQLCHARCTQITPRCTLVETGEWKDKRWRVNRSLAASVTAGARVEEVREN